MQIARRFTTSGRDPYEGIAFRTATSEIRNPDGSVVFAAEGFEVPADWSQVACDVLAQKYFRKAGVPRNLISVDEADVPRLAVAPAAPMPTSLRCLPKDERTGAETSAKQVLRPPRRHLDLLGLEGRLFRHRRRRPRPSSTSCASCWRGRWARPTRRNGSIPACIGPMASTARRRGISMSITAPASCAPPTAPMSTRSRMPASSSRSPTISSTKAASWICGCARRGCSNTAPAPAPISRELRGDGEKLSGGGRSSGLMSFLKIGDRAAGAIKSGGTTRRAAKMVIVDIDHPDIEAFIDWKVHRGAEGGRARRRLEALRQASQRCHGGLPRRDRRRPVRPEEKPGAETRNPRGARGDDPGKLSSSAPSSSPARATTAIDFRTYDTDWDSEAYLTVAGQNSNNSVRVTDDFLAAVEADADWDLHRRTDGKVAQDPAGPRRCGTSIAYAAWASADPGVQFDTTINEWHTCPESRAASTPRTRARNTCSSTTRRAISPRST